jgi:Ca2+-binding EF-hand superfamily protein
LLRRLGHRLDAKEVEEMIKTVDANSDGQVQFSEFITMVQMLPAYADGEL